MLSHLPFHHSQSFQSSKRHQRSLNQEQQQLWFLTNFLGNVETIKEVSFQDMQFRGVIHLFNGPFARNGHIWNKKPYWKAKDAEGSSRTRGGPLGPGRPIFRPNGGPKGPQFVFFKTAPPLPYLRVWMTGPPSTWRSGSATGGAGKTEATPFIKLISFFF